MTHKTSRPRLSLLGAWVTLAAVAVACSSSPGSPPTFYFPSPGGPGQGGTGSLDGSADHDGQAAGGDGGLGPSDGSTPEAAASAMDVSDQFTSGSRLKAKWWVAADGADAFETWHDAQLGTDCFFSMAGDNTLRCLPYDVLYVNGEFADSSCTKPIVIDAPSCPAGPPAYLGTIDSSTCPSLSHVFARGSSAPANHYFKLPGIPCQAISRDPSWSYYELGAEIAPSTFVDATYTNGPAPGGLMAVYTQASDGAKGFDHWAPATGPSYACDFTVATGGTYRCLPNSGTSAECGGFSDSKCTAPACSYGNNCSSPAYGVNFSWSCPYTTQVLALGAKSSSFYSIDNGQCTNINSTGLDSYAAGADVTDTFSAGMLLPPSGNTRLQSVNILTAGGLLESWSWQDSQRNEGCSPQTAADGQSRCLPYTQNLTGYYADSACTKPVAVFWPSFECGTVPTEAAWTDDTCPSLTHVFPLGAKFTSATMYFRNPGGSTTCTPDPTAGDDVYEIGAEIPAASFEAVNEVLK